MNYYRHHLGDYDAATAHLSVIEDGAYSRLIRLYYRTEKPLPADIMQVCRLVRAQSKAEREAVDAMLREFFDLRQDGWHQERCDEEIEAAREEGEENAARKENERERQRRHRQRRKELFAALRMHGSIPKWDSTIEQLEAQLSRFESRDNNAPVTRDESVTDTDQQRLSISHKPIANSQEKDLTPPTPLADAKGANGRRKRKPATPCPESIEITDEMYDWANGKGLDDATVTSETEEMLAYHAAKGNEWADWKRAWQTWMLRAVKYRSERMKRVN